MRAVCLVEAETIQLDLPIPIAVMMSERGIPPFTLHFPVVPRVISPLSSLSILPLVVFVSLRFTQVLLIAFKPLSWTSVLTKHAI